jgi:hypothetical protein
MLTSLFQEYEAQHCIRSGRAKSGAPLNLIVSQMKTRIATDTATVVFFDPACLRHRLQDDPDWWSIPSAELDEVNLGNVLFLNLGADGVYDLEVASSLNIDRPYIEAYIRNISGTFFVGAGEYVSSGGLEPEAIYGNLFLSVTPGSYLVRAHATEKSKISISFEPTTCEPQNSFGDLLRLG